MSTDPFRWQFCPLANVQPYQRLSNPEPARARRARYLRRRAEQLRFDLTPVEGEVS